MKEKQVQRGRQTGIGSGNGHGICEGRSERESTHSGVSGGGGERCRLRAKSERQPEWLEWERERHRSGGDIGLDGNIWAATEDIGNYRG